MFNRHCQHKWLVHTKTVADVQRRYRKRNMNGGVHDRYTESDTTVTQTTTILFVCHKCGAFNVVIMDGKEIQ